MQQVKFDEQEDIVLNDRRAPCSTGLY